MPATLKQEQLSTLGHAVCSDIAYPVDVLRVDPKGRARDPTVLCPVGKGEVDDGYSQEGHPDGSPNLAETPAQHIQQVSTWYLWLCSVTGVYALKIHDTDVLCRPTGPANMPVASHELMS